MKTFGVMLVLAIVATIGLFTSYQESHYHDHVATCTVTGKDRTSGSGDSGSSDMRVYTKQCDTLHDSDSMWRGKYNSSNLFGQIQIGHTYRFEVAGYRSGILSAFPNIVAIKGEVK